MKILWKQFLRANHLNRNLARYACNRHLHTTLNVKTLSQLAPEIVEQRIQLFDEVQHQQEQDKASKQKKIDITLPDGSTVTGYSWKTTPYEVAQGISKRLAKEAVVAKVNGVLWDLERSFERDSTVEILKYDSPDVQSVFWHSSAHVLGEAMELQYNGLLCYGPPIDNGFYYDMYISEKQVSSNDFPQLEATIKDIVKQNQGFVRLEMGKEELMRMFSYNPFKMRILEEKVTTPTTTVYRCGPLIDLCLGPHVRHTGQLKSFALMKNSASHWLGNRDAEQLQRIYGISFPNDQLMKQWKRAQAEAAARDHRKIGREQELFFFHELSPGSCFFLPDGAHIYNKLISFLREEYVKYGYEEVVTPNIYSTKLWEKSGHWQHYAENMFSFDVEEEKYALKPMNCPGHCLVFDTRPRSWRELPIRMADFGVLHRNELSGTLGGLTRVRRFQQDDAHIFCTLEQVQDEIKGCLDFLRNVYTVFGFSFKLKLATRPEKYMGDLETWSNAERQLEKSLDDFGMDWELNEGDGAFYGPKIDIELCDALGRSHQCATIQLDFQLPERFGLSYVTDVNETKSPVMIHRAILGSVERMIAILTESYAGKWPFWLSPRQAIVIPVSTKYDEYAVEVADKLSKEGFKASANVNVGEMLSKKIRNAHLKQYNYVLVVGEKEMQSDTVTVRPRDSEAQEVKSLTEVIAMFRALELNKDRAC